MSFAADMTDQERVFHLTRETRARPGDLKVHIRRSPPAIIVYKMGIDNRWTEVGDKTDRQRFSLVLASDFLFTQS